MSQCKIPEIPDLLGQGATTRGFWLKSLPNSATPTPERQNHRETNGTKWSFEVKLLASGEACASHCFLDSILKIHCSAITWTCRGAWGGSPQTMGSQNSSSNIGRQNAQNHDNVSVMIFASSRLYFVQLRTENHNTWQCGTSNLSLDMFTVSYPHSQ